jgi:type II secretory pathway pseudopilin PulG
MSRFPSIILPPSPSRRRHSAFTITEMVVAMAVFSLVIISVVYSHLFGMKMFTITSTKLTASHYARAALNRVRDEVRSAKVLYVGGAFTNISGTIGFTNLAPNQFRAGNAIQICPTVNTNNFVLYFVDSNDHKLKRAISGAAGSEVIAQSITNQVIFRAENYLGDTLTNDLNNRVIEMTLEFYQWEFAKPQPAGGIYDYYRLQTRITRRMVD